MVATTAASTDTAAGVRATAPVLAVAATVVSPVAAASHFPLIRSCDHMGYGVNMITSHFSLSMAP